MFNEYPTEKTEILGNQHERPEAGAVLQVVAVMLAVMAAIVAALSEVVG